MAADTEKPAFPSTFLSIAAISALHVRGDNLAELGQLVVLVQNILQDLDQRISALEEKES